MVTVCHLSMGCKALYLVCSLLLIFLPCVPSLSHNKHKAQKDTCTCNKEHMCEGRTEINCPCDRMDVFSVSSGKNASFFSWWNTTTKLNVLLERGLLQSWVFALHIQCSHQENNFQIETLTINPKDTATIKKNKARHHGSGKTILSYLSGSTTYSHLDTIYITQPVSHSCVHSFYFSEHFFLLLFTNSSLVGAQEQKMMNERTHVGYVNQTLCIYSGNPLPLSSGTPHWPVWRTTFSQSGITLSQAHTVNIFSEQKD